MENREGTSDLSPEMLRDEYEKQNFDLKQLLEISKSLNSTLDYNILIDSIMYICMGQMRVLKAGLFAKKGLDSESFSLHRNYKGFELDRDVDYAIHEDHGIIKLFSRAFRTYSFEEVCTELGGTEGLDAFVSLQPSLIVPLKAKGVINGIIVLGEKIDEDDFTDYERDYVLNIAVLAAIAINNAFLFEMTTTDMMTKLKMKHYFYTVLVEKMETSSEGDSPLSVVMMDVDFFKRFNDAYGHSCGDAVLKQVARVIMSNIRSVDLAARYGGEEFVILLPDTDISIAKIVAERIRVSIQNLTVEYEGRHLGVTISMGIAQFDPERDISGKSIIDRADRALYLSKQNGRNKVSVLVE
jgi:two-component system, cell cycle response regulator